MKTLARLTLVSILSLPAAAALADGYGYDSNNTARLQREADALRRAADEREAEVRRQNQNRQEQERINRQLDEFNRGNMGRAPHNGGANIAD